MREGGRERERRGDEKRMTEEEREEIDGWRRGGGKYEGEKIIKGKE